MVWGVTPCRNASPDTVQVLTIIETIDTLNSLLNAGVPVEDAKREFTKSYFRDGHCCNLNVWDHDWRRASRSQLRNIGIIGSIYATTKRNNETDGAASYGIRADVKRLTGLADTLAECEDLVLAGDVSAVVTALQDSIFKSGNKVDDCKAPDMPLGAWHDLYSNQWVEPQTDEEKLKDSRISCLLGIYEAKLREERQRFAQATANSNAMSEQSKGGWTD